MTDASDSFQTFLSLTLGSPEILLPLNLSLALRSLGSGWDRASWDIFSIQSLQGCYLNCGGRSKSKSWAEGWHKPQFTIAIYGAFIRSPSSGLTASSGLSYVIFKMTMWSGCSHWSYLILFFLPRISGTEKLSNFWRLEMSTAGIWTRAVWPQSPHMQPLHYIGIASLLRARWPLWGLTLLPWTNLPPDSSQHLKLIKSEAWAKMALLSPFPILDPDVNPPESIQKKSLIFKEKNQSLWDATELRRFCPGASCSPKVEQPLF